MQKPKISIIIPIYGVEPYLRKCLDSVVNQTYRNLEIILVDDGSPDGCGVICDEYAKTDSRILVIHKENGGVSSARNAGLAAATGAWIGWVDPDDWIEETMFEYMLQNVQQAGADIAVCGRYIEYPNRIVERTWDGVHCFNRETALEKLLENDTMQNFLWDKLWKRELYDGIKFPEGRTYEDIAVMHRLFEKASVVCCLPEIQYHYVQRGDSIVSNVTLKNRVNHYLAAWQRYIEMEAQWPQFKNLLEAQCVASSINIWCAYLQNPPEERKRYWTQVLDISEFAKIHYRSALSHMGLGLAGRMIVYLTPYPKFWAFFIARLIAFGYKLRHGRAL